MSVIYATHIFSFKSFYQTTQKKKRLLIAKKTYFFQDHGRSILCFLRTNRLSMVMYFLFLSHQR